VGILGDSGLTQNESEVAVAWKAERPSNLLPLSETVLIGGADVAGMWQELGSRFE
jgi:hypothetical protein